MLAERGKSVVCETVRHYLHMLAHPLDKLPLLEENPMIDITLKSSATSFFERCSKVLNCKVMP